MKKYNNGLVLGKMMPLTNGHLYLIETAASMCNNVYVMVCTDNTQPISGVSRVWWVIEAISHLQNVKVIWCQDKNPQYPNECESLDMFYNDYWVPSVKSRVKDLDVIFTSEDYGDEFAEYLRIKHVLVDKERKVVPISATKVRENSFKYWNYIPDNVKYYFTKKVVIMGPESTGKSVLTKRLAEHFNCDYVEEYGRTYYEENNGNLNSISDFRKIAFRHDNLINNCKNNSKGKFIFIDTEAITTKVFMDLYLGIIKDDFIENIINNQHFDYIFLMDVDVPWFDDGTREFKDNRNEHLSYIKNELIRNNRNFVQIDGDYDERFYKIINILENEL